jgi:tetratricopeptide (TPR) repeat protein
VQVEEVPIEGLGHNLAPQMAYFLGLASFFSGWTAPKDVLERGLVAIDAYYDSLSLHYHFDVAVPVDAYGQLGWKLFEAGRKDEAGEVFRTWVARHPHSPLALASLGAFYREMGQSNEALLMLEEALKREEESAVPRQAFMDDLKRDMEALRRRD